MQMHIHVGREKMEKMERFMNDTRMIKSIVLYAKEAKPGVCSNFLFPWMDTFSDCLIIALRYVGVLERCYSRVI